MTTQTKPQIEITIENEQPITTSRNVAENFEKEHKNVLRDIEKLLDEDRLSFEQMFSKGTEPDAYGREQKIYYMNRDGFTFLAMGFTGKEARKFKLAYIDQFNKMEESLNELYHVSETALTNNVVKHLEEKLFTKIDQRFEQYEENYRPTHANKMNINRYIKSGLGNEQEPEEADLVKQRVLLMLGAENWQDVPYKKLINNMRLIDESIQAVKSFRTRRQLDLFESYL